MIGITKSRKYTKLSRSLAPRTEESPLEIPDQLPIREEEVATTGCKTMVHEKKKLSTKGLSIKRIEAQQVYKYLIS